MRPPLLNWSRELRPSSELCRGFGRSASATILWMPSAAARSASRGRNSASSCWELFDRHRSGHTREEMAVAKACCPGAVIPTPHDALHRSAADASGRVLARHPASVGKNRTSPIAMRNDRATMKKRRQIETLRLAGASRVLYPGTPAVSGLLPRDRILRAA